MGNSIRGLTVEISADATKFKQELSHIKSEAKTTQTDLNNLQKSLKLEFDNQKFLQAQMTAQQAIDKTAEIADTLKSRLKYLEESGNVNTAEYRKLQNELSRNELQAVQLKHQLEEINKIKLDHVAKQFSNIGSGIEKAGKAIAPFSALSAGAITSLGALGVKTAATGAAIDDLALRLGISAEKVQEYQYVTAQAGVEWDVFEKALIKARAAMLDLSTGATNTATKAIQSLGLSIENFATQEEMFDAIITALSGMEDKTLQAAYANTIFGDKIANQMLPYLNAGSKAINQFKSEFAQIGALSNEQVAGLANLDDTLYLLKQSSQQVVNQLGASFAPLIKYIANTLQTSLIPKLQSLSRWFNSLTLGQQEFALKALLLVTVLAPLTMGIGKIVSGVGGLISILPQLGSALSFLAAHPIIAIIGVIAGLLTYLYTTNEQFRNSINSLLATLGETLQPIMGVIITVLQIVMALLTPIIELLSGQLISVINILVTLLNPLLGIVGALFNMLNPILNVILQVVTMGLTPLITSIQVLFSILQLLLELCLTPLVAVFELLKQPLQAIGTLMGWLAPIFKTFADIVTNVFKGAIEIINSVLGFIESCINKAIGMINNMIEAVNKSMGWLGVKLNKIGTVSIKIDTSSIEGLKNINTNINATPPNLNTQGQGQIQFNKNQSANDWFEQFKAGQAYDKIDTSNISGDIYNNDYSTVNKTQNITVTIQNYAQEVDTDKLIREINLKLAEAY